MKPPSKHQSLFFTPRSPNGKRLQMRFQDHMHASDNAVTRALGRVGRWIKNHVYVGAEGSKSGSDRFDVRAGIGYTNDKRGLEEQERWRETHPGHEFSGSGMNGFR